MGAVVAAALVALAVVVSHGGSSAAPASPGPSAQASAPASPSGPVTPVHPSAAVMQLQRELGQLNYYEGPVDGLMGPQTIAAIKDLQRQAGLPQTGAMNAATQKALDNYLAHGNNQMGGNS
jgi:peptidoglycan hydrolase-like protein with peptidoglycan-binding domain